MILVLTQLILNGTFSVTGGTYVDTDAANDGVNITVRGTSQSTPDYLVARDASGDFSANMITSDVTGDLTGTTQFATDAHGLTNMRTFRFLVMVLHLPYHLMVLRMLTST